MKQLLRSEDGLTKMEYTLIAVLVVFACYAGMYNSGKDLSTLYCTISRAAIVSQNAIPSCPEDADIIGEGFPPIIPGGPSS
jgi:Flp pilus assembly pilin Flp